MLVADHPLPGVRGSEQHAHAPSEQPRGEQAARAAAPEQAIEAELVGHLVAQAPTGFVTGTVTVLAVLLVLWNAAPRGILLLWLLVLALLSLPAFVVVWRYGRAAPRVERVASWRAALAVAYGLAGIGWGAAAILLYPRVATPDQVFLLFILGGSGVGGMAALAPVRAAYVAYLTATFFPMIGALLAGGSLSSAATGLMLLIFWAAAIVLASEIRRLLVRSLELRFENLGLIDDLSTAKDAAEAASRTKSVFLANVSHELRTPLALILGPIRRLLGVHAGDEDVRRDLETVERNAQVLLKHVSDLLDVAKLEASGAELDRSRLDLVALVRRTVSLFDAVARERRVTLQVETPAELVLVADAGKLERVLLNLLSNAMKFVPDGGRVQTAVRVEGDDVVLSVEDDGPGVPVPLREVIFERFRRGDDAATRRFGGTGLGLAIARELVERHGGRIEVGDGAAGGALFRVRLPLVSEPAGAVAAGASPPEADRRALDEVARQTVAELRPPSEPVVAIRGSGSGGLVLLVEDNPEMSRFLVRCLTPDYRVATALDGRQGLERAIELRPDLILTDVMLPVMGGDTLVRELRAHPELGGIPIVVLTAKADDELRVRLLREGAQDFLTKPFAVEELRARVANLVMLKRTRDVLQGALSSQSRDLATLADQLAAASRSKDEFLAVLSHELRTPLTPILSWSFLLREGQLSAEEQERALRAIERNAKLQGRIVEDLLDVSRAITGKLRLNLQPIALDPVIQAASDAVRAAAEAKGIRLETDLRPEVGLISGDPERLQQVVWNLLANAIKFTPPGGRVTVRLEHVDESARLAVTDNGAGIEPAVLPRLFERFWQADSTTTRTQGGLGLGLAVVRHLVELHGGTVHAESAGQGRGATFTVTLPLLPAERPVDDLPPHLPIAENLPRWTPTFRGLKVLVVDDDEDTCETVGAVLRRTGAEVRTCLSASQALTAMDTWVPDLLLSDIGMPGEDGYSLIRKIRARPTAAGGRMLAVALTAYGSQDDRRKALSAGFQVHVGKPIEPTQLVRVVASVTGHAAGARQ
ncbi:MAG TPA: ATP-binding protein [Candidatus Nitrosopolaris sp.]|nr:ATP-binding protein [Candidatus Nitrosopolaris sp.]